MTISTRVTLFYLAGLAAMLTAIVVALAVITRREADRQALERLQGGIDTLVASAEIEPHELEWDRDERQIALGNDAGPEDVRWLLRDVDGQVIDRSANLILDIEQQLLERAVESLPLQGLAPIEASDQSLLLHRRIRAAHPEQPPPDDPLDDGGYPEITFSAWVSLAPGRDMARQVAWTAVWLAVTAWTAAALAARWYGRRALAPMRQLSDQARRISGGSPGALLIVPRTRDEIETLGSALNELLRTWGEDFDRQGAFAAAAAHQLRTPLTIMLGEFDIALRRDRSAGEYRDALERASRATRDLQQVVEGLLLLARLRDGETPDVETFAVSDWLQQCVESARSRHFDRSILLTAAEDASYVRANRALLRQLLDNLIDNAVQYSPPDSPIQIELSRAASDVLVSIIDLGPGISADQRAHVFEPFFRTADARAARPDGSGLGLSIAARIAAVHGGRLQLAGDAGAGTHIMLVLPIAEV